MSTLGDKARVAVLWSTGFSLFRDLLQFGVTMVLVRLLAPEAYGQFGLVTAIVGFLNVLSLENFIAYTLQVRSDDEVHMQDHFTAGAVIQVSVCGLVNVVALALRWVEAYAAIAPLVHVMSVALLLDWPSGVRIKMLQRALDWRRLRLLYGIGLLAASLLAIGMAAYGLGVYALLVPGLMKRVVFIGDLFISQGWRPTWAWSAEKYIPAWRFGLTRMTSGFLGAGRKLVESSLFIPLVGFAHFGLYGRAVGLGHIICSRFAFFLMQTLYPVLTQIEPGTPTYARASGLVLRSVAWVVIPLGVLFAILADPVIRVIYGGKWVEVIPLLPWAMVAGAAGAIAHVAYMLALANQQQKRCMLSDLWMLVGTGVCLVWLLPKSMGMYLIGLAVMQMVALMLMLVWLYVDQAIVVTEVVSALIHPLVAALGAFMMCEGVRRWMGGEVHDVWTVCAYGVSFSLAYAGVLRCLFAPQLGELVRYAPGGHRLTRLLLLGT